MRTPFFAQLGLVIVIASLMLLSSQIVTAQTGGVRNVAFDGVTFRYDASLADGVVSKVVPEYVVPDGGFWMAQPRHIEFDFTDFQGSSSRSDQPVIYIFPVRSDYTSLTPGETRDYWLPQVQGLREMLSKQPPPSTIVKQITAPPRTLPEVAYLPPVNAAAILTGKLGYLRFQNGLGIRFLVQTSQDASPPGPDNTSYTFQGLTNDGKYYVAAFFSAFPTAIPPMQPPTVENIGAYYLDVIDRFDKISNDAYTPNLDSLDNMIGSLSVHPVKLDNASGLPNTGDDTPSDRAGWLVLAALFLLCGGLALLARAKALTSE